MNNEDNLINVGEIGRVLRAIGESDAIHEIYSKAKAAAAPAPDEPPLWYGRFVDFYLPTFLTHGTGSLSEAYYRYYEHKHGHRPTRKGYTSSWGEAAKRYHWKERAQSAVSEIATDVLQEAADGQLREILRQIVRRKVQVEIVLKITDRDRTRRIPLGVVDL